MTAYINFRTEEIICKPNSLPHSTKQKPKKKVRSALVVAPNPVEKTPDIPFKATTRIYPLPYLKPLKFFGNYNSYHRNLRCV